MSCELADLIDIPNLQMLMDRFHAATGIPVGIISCSGEILVATGWQDICTRFHRVHPVTAERCRLSDEYIKSHVRTQGYVEYKCRNGLWDLAVPIVIGGEHTGTLFLGQFFYADQKIDEEFFVGQARECGFDPDGYLNALRRVPVFTRERVRQIMDFYLPFVNFLVSTGLANRQREEAEKALRESEGQYREIFENTSDGIFLVDVTADRRFRFAGFNPAQERMVGLSSKKTAGGLVEDVVREDLAGKLLEHFSNCLEKAGPISYEEELNLPGGPRCFHTTLVPMRNAAGEIHRILGVARDITERRRTEVALKESEKKFVTAFRAAPSVLAICSWADGRHLEVNDTFEAVLGYTREEVVGRTMLDLEIWEDPEERERFSAILRKRGRTRGLDARLKRKSGESVVGLLSAEPIEVKGEKCLLIQFNDITDRRRMEEEIEILNTNLMSHASQLEAANQELEAFNYTVSHDLRSPLTGISGYCNLLLNSAGCTLSNEGRRYLETIRSSAREMDGLIDTLLRFSRLSRCEMTKEEVDLSAMAEDIAIDLRLGAPERPAEFSVAAGVKVQGDPRLLEIVLKNLIGNAWKYTGGCRETRIEFGSVGIDGTTACFVRDNGDGFDMVDASRLFRPFERLPGTEHTAGHGIGLATVHRIIQRHGGRIWAEGERGKGATFFFCV